MAYIRNPADVIGRLLLSLCVGLVIGLVFINANPGECSPACMLTVVCVHVCFVCGCGCVCVCVGRCVDCSLVHANVCGCVFC
jgi:hypothetical protein